MRHLVLSVVALAALAVFPSQALSHCQIPCGIYTDEMRFAMIDEHITTVEKAMKQIQELSSADPVNMNQVVRWVTNKESHAQEIQEIVNAYFFTQRLKPVADGADGYEDYLTSLKLTHAITVAAMKCKQTTDAANIAALRKATADYKAHYFKDAEHDHE